MSENKVKTVVVPPKHKGCTRGFIQTSKSWYAESCLPDGDILDRVTVGFYYPDGGTSGEFEVEWEELAGKWTPRLKAYDDGWSSLFNFGDVLEAMADIDGMDSSPDEFVRMLEVCGIKNMTPKKA